MKNWGIRARILLLVLLPALFIATALSGYAIYSLLGDLNRDLQSYGTALARQLAGVAEFSAYSGDRAGLNRIAQAALVESHISRIDFFDPQGEALTTNSSGNLRFPPVGSEQEITITDSLQHLRIVAPIMRRSQEIDDPFLQSSPTPTLSSTPTILGWVSVEITKSYLLERRSEAIWVTLSAFAVCLTLAFLVVGWLTQRVVAPILRLSKAVDLIRCGDLSVSIPADSGGELQALEEGINAMTSALKESHETLAHRIHLATSELAQKKEEAERANLAKSRFLAAASHDLRQPLHALSFFVADLKKTVATPELIRLAERIGVSVNSISELLNTLLDISRLDVAGVTPEMRPIPLNNLFERLELAFARPALDKGLQLRFRARHAWAYTDPVLLERLIANLVSNAIQYTEHGSILVIVRRHVGKLQIEVRDSGIGIPQEFADAIFQEFFQVSNQEREARKGLGLGLAIVSRLAKALQVEVTVRSAVGKGSIFSVTVLAADARPISTLAAALAEQKEQILIHPSTQEIEALRSFLEQWGYQCVTSSQNQSDQPTYIALIADTPEALSELAKDSIGQPILLGISTPLPAHPDWLTLPLPLRPAKLRALLNRVQ